MENKSQIPYYQVAKEALMNWNGLSEEEADKLIEKSSFEEIESKVYAQNSMSYAITSIGRKLGLDEEEIDKFSDEMFGKSEDTEMTEQAHKKLSHAWKYKNYMAELAVDAMEAVHDGWVEDNAKHFFTKKADRGQQYQYLPLELIGWDEAKSDLLFIKPIIHAIGGYAAEKEIKEECNSRTTYFFERYSDKTSGGTLDMQIHNLDDLGDFITQGGLDWFHWTPEIEAAMSDGVFVHGTILPQIREKGFVKDTELVAELEDSNIFEVDGPSKDDFIEDALKSEEFVKNFGIRPGEAKEELDDIEKNRKARSALIEQIQAKRDTIAKQREQLQELQQVKAEQVSKDSQQH